jgi:hypothetical protein
MKMMKIIFLIFSIAVYCRKVQTLCKDYKSVRIHYDALISNRPNFIFNDYIDTLNENQLNPSDEEQILKMVCLIIIPAIHVSSLTLPVISLTRLNKILNF